MGLHPTYPLNLHARRRAGHKAALLISGCMSDRSAASAKGVQPESRRQTRFFGHFVVAHNKVTRLSGRTPDLNPPSQHA